MAACARASDYTPENHNTCSSKRTVFHFAALYAHRATSESEAVSRGAVWQPAQERAKKRPDAALVITHNSKRIALPLSSLNALHLLHSLDNAWNHPHRKSHVTIYGPRLYLHDRSAPYHGQKKRKCTYAPPPFINLHCLQCSGELITDCRKAGRHVNQVTSSQKLGQPNIYHPNKDHKFSIPL